MKASTTESGPAGGESLLTETSVLSPGDRVVYPNQGVCRVTGVETQTIGGEKLELVVMAREEDGARVMVPRKKVAGVGLRRVASKEYVEGVFHYLAAQYDDPELDWKIRHRDNADRLVTGGVLGIAEVVKGLHGLSRIRPLPTKEREQYDNARHLLVAEISASLGVTATMAEDYVDYALMPPVGTTFKLKPPPKPVVLPVRILHRKPAAKAEDDLGLDDLGIELGELGELGEGAEAGEAKAAGGEEGEGAEGAEALPAADEDAVGGDLDLPLPAVDPAPARAPAARKAAPPAAAPRKAPPERKAAPEARKAPPPAKAEPPPRKARAEKPEKKAAPAKKPAPARKAAPPAKKPARGKK